MIDKSTISWFWRGFTVMAVLFIAGIFVIQPSRGQNGLRGNQLTEMTVTGDRSLTLTDDPQGRQFVPLPEAYEQLSNEEAPVDQQPAVLAGVSGETAVETDTQNTSYLSPLVVPAADFRSDGDDPSTTLFSFSGGYIQGASTGSGCVMAPAYLPDDAVLGTLAITAKDEDGVNNVEIRLYRVNNFTGTVNSLATASTTGSSSSIVEAETTIVANQTVSYPTYSYYLTSCLRTESTKLYSVQIHYHQP